jgi:hypothetical protein
MLSVLSLLLSARLETDAAFIHSINNNTFTAIIFCVMTKTNPGHHGVYVLDFKIHFVDESKNIILLIKL